MPLVTTKEMFERSMKEHFAIGAFNINNMEFIQAYNRSCKWSKITSNITSIIKCYKICWNKIFNENGWSSSRNNRYSNSTSF